MKTIKNIDFSIRDLDIELNQNQNETNKELKIYIYLKTLLSSNCEICESFYFLHISMDLRDNCPHIS